MRQVMYSQKGSAVKYELIVTSMYINDFTNI